MARTTIALALVTLSTMIGCRDPQPCRNCDIAEDHGDDGEDMPLPDVPDLPCGGADFMTDNFNCGTCGHKCPTWYVGTQYEAGTCKAGVCGPVWSACWPDTGFWNTCAELCAAGEGGCVPSGCSGYTGLLFEIFPEDGCWPNDVPPVTTMTGACDEPIPWMSTGEYPRQVKCCCDFDY